MLLQCPPSLSSARVFCLPFYPLPNLENTCSLQDIETKSSPSQFHVPHVFLVSMCPTAPQLSLKNLSQVTLECFWSWPKTLLLHCQIPVEDSPRKPEMQQTLSDFDIADDPQPSSEENNKKIQKFCWSCTKSFTRTTCTTSYTSSYTPVIISL